MAKPETSWFLIQIAEFQNSVIHQNAILRICHEYHSFEYHFDVSEDKQVRGVQSSLSTWERSEIDDATYLGSGLSELWKVA